MWDGWWISRDHGQKSDVGGHSYVSHRGRESEKDTHTGYNYPGRIPDLMFYPLTVQTAYRIASLVFLSSTATNQNRESTQGTLKI